VKSSVVPSAWMVPIPVWPTLPVNVDAVIASVELWK
jgi:hypothetical protein